MMFGMKDYLLDLRLVTVSAASVALFLAKAGLPLWPGWWVARKILKRGADRLPTVLSGGAVSAALATCAISVGIAQRGMSDPAPDAGIWPAGVLAAILGGLFVLWPTYALCLHVAMRRRAAAPIAKRESTG